MFKKPLWQTVWTKIRLFASIFNSSVMLGNYLQQTTSADDIFRCVCFLVLKGQKGQQPKQLGGLNALHWYEIFAIEPVVVKHKIYFARMIVIPN